MASAVTSPAPHIDTLISEELIECQLQVLRASKNATAITIDMIRVLPIFLVSLESPQQPVVLRQNL